MLVEIFTPVQDVESVDTPIIQENAHMGNFKVWESECMSKTCEATSASSKNMELVSVKENSFLIFVDVFSSPLTSNTAKLVR